MRGRPDYRSIDHTGDIGIVVRAVRREELYEKAALALFDILTDLDGVREESRSRIEVSGEDREELMVRWLADLLFLHDTRRLMLARFEIRAMDDRSLAADVWGETFDPARHVIRTELKAVTYHDLLVSEDRDGWSARIIFDV